MSDNYLKAWFERAERMEEEQKTLGSHKRDLFTEAKGNGYNAKALRLMLKERKEDEAERDQLEVDMALYRAQLGMAVSLVRDDGVSLRKAAKAAGVSKSSVHRALAVPAASQETALDLPPSPEPEFEVGTGTHSDIPFEISGGSMEPLTEEDLRRLKIENDALKAKEQGDRQSPLRDGGAPVATSTVGPAVTTLADEAERLGLTGVVAILEARREAEDDLAIPSFLKREKVTA